MWPRPPSVPHVFLCRSSSHMTTSLAQYFLYHGEKKQETNQPDRPLSIVIEEEGGVKRKKKPQPTQPVCSVLIDVHLFLLIKLRRNEHLPVAGADWTHRPTQPVLSLSERKQTPRFNQQQKEDQFNPLPLIPASHLPLKNLNVSSKWWLLDISSVPPTPCAVSINTTICQNIRASLSPRTTPTLFR